MCARVMCGGSPVPFGRPGLVWNLLELMAPHLTELRGAYPHSAAFMYKEAASTSSCFPPSPFVYNRPRLY